VSTETRDYFDCIGHVMGADTVIQSEADLEKEITSIVERGYEELIPVREMVERVLTALRARNGVTFTFSEQRDPWLRSAAELAAERRPAVPFALLRTDLEAFRDLGVAPAMAVNAVLSVGIGRPVPPPVKPPSIEITSQTRLHVTDRHLEQERSNEHGRPEEHDRGRLR